MSKNTYVSKADELDTDENGAQRITPAGSIWTLSLSEGESHYLDCKATGASIICDSRELAAQFAQAPCAMLTEDVQQ